MIIITTARETQTCLGLLYESVRNLILPLGSQDILVNPAGYHHLLIQQNLIKLVP